MRRPHDVSPPPGNGRAVSGEFGPVSILCAVRKMFLALPGIAAP